MTDITRLLGDEADSLLNHECRGVPAESIHKPARTSSIA